MSDLGNASWPDGEVGLTEGQERALSAFVPGACTELYGASSDLYRLGLIEHRWSYYMPDQLHPEGWHLTPKGIEACKRLGIEVRE